MKCQHSLNQFIAGGRTDLLKDTINGWDANAVMCFDTWTFNHDRAYYSHGFIIPNPGNIMFFSNPIGFFEMRLIDFGLAFGGDWHSSDDPQKNDSFKLENWHFEILGQFPIFFEMQWIQQRLCEEWSQKIENISYSQLEPLALEVPYEWRTHIDYPLLQKFLLHLIARGSNLSHVFQASFSTGIIQRLLAANP